MSNSAKDIVLDDWDEIILGDVSEMRYGKMPKKKYLSNEEKYPVFSGYRQVGFYPEYNADENLIVVARGVGGTGDVKISPAKCYVTNLSIIIDLDDKVLDKNFLYYKYQIRNLRYLDTGSAQSQITISDLKTLVLDVPPTSEQKAIAAVLSSFDDKIELLRKQNETLEQIAQTIFKEWFANFNFPDENGRPYKDNGGKMVASDLGEIPEGWRVGTINNFDAIVTDYVANGSFASLKQNVNLYDEPNYALFIRNTDLKSGFVNKVYVDRHSYEFLDKTKLFGGEIIISNVGDVGSVFLCPYFNIPMTLGNNVIVIKSSCKGYLYSLFRSFIGKHLLNSITGGSAQPKFNKTDFRSLEMTIPSTSILKTFNDFSWTIYQKFLENDIQITKIAELRDYILPKLMSGQLRVKDFIYED